MKAKKPVWTEGLFITQHHFQQLDRYHESLIGERLRAVAASDWGVSLLEVDERALEAGQLRIRAISAVLPDGTPIAVGDGDDDRVGVRAIDATVFPANLSTIDAYIGLFEERDNGANVELEPRPDSVLRYEREQLTVFDYNGGPEQTIAVARRNLRVLLGDESRDGFVGIRFARIERVPGGVLKLAPAFVPPVTRVGASPVLAAGFRRLLGVMVAKQRSLAAGRKQRTDLAVDYEPGDNVKFWLLHTLNENIPRFSHIVQHQAANPETAYLALATFIGQLCTFAVDGDPTRIASYQFLDLTDTFPPMFQRAQALLDAVVAERYIEIPLQKRSDGLNLGQIEDPAVLRYEHFLAVEASGVPEAVIRERIAKLTKIASWNQVTSILNSAVNGCKLELEYRPPGALPLRAGVVFFRVHHTPEFWSDIVTTASIAIYQPVSPEAIELSLYAVDPKNLK